MIHRLIIFCVLLSYVQISISGEGPEYLSWDEIQNNFNEVSKNSKALGHVRCFYENHEQDKFPLNRPKKETYKNRCFSKKYIGLDSTRYFSIIDYTVTSDQRRMFIIDRLTGAISRMAVAHGRYKAGFFNHTMKENQNTVKEIKYYSNVEGSMASSSGFFIAGQDFEASDFGRSLVVYGIEEGINDNACERDIVIHPHFLVSKSKAHVLSSGCMMVSPSSNNNVINLLKGTSTEDMKLETTGGLVFIYGPREAQWKDATCPGNFRPYKH